MRHYLNLQSSIFLVTSIVTLCMALLFAGHMQAPNLFMLILMIALFGVPHGALDALFAQQAFALNTVSRWATFIALYLALALLVFIFWRFLPTLFFISFLGFSALHFADDISHVKPRFISMLYGLNIILLPCVLHGAQLSELYDYIIGNAPATLLLSVMKPLAIVIALMTICTLLLNKKPIELHNKLDIVSVGLLMLLVHPLLAFTIYFCFMHSARHLIRSKFFFMQQSNQLFLLMLILPTLSVLVFCMLIYTSMPTNQMDENLIKLTFVTLAALTLPHAYLLEKVGFIKAINQSANLNNTDAS